jgi:hypothetical protein
VGDSPVRYVKDTYNFDKSSFIIGVISTGAVITGSKHCGRLKIV